MLGEPRQPRPRGPGPPERVSEAREHVPEAGQVRHDRRVTEVLSFVGPIRGDERCGVLCRRSGRGIRLGSEEKVGRVRRAAAARNADGGSAFTLTHGDDRHAPLAPCPVRSHGVVGEPELRLAPFLHHDDAAVRPGRLEHPVDKVVRRREPGRGGGHRPDSSRVFSTLTPRNRADGQPWLTGAT